MKRAMILFAILLLPFLLAAQETTSVAPKPVEKQSYGNEAPESFFNDLLKALTADTTETAPDVKADDKTDDLPVPDPLGTIQMEEKVTPVDKDKIDTDKPMVPVPEQSVPNQGIDLGGSKPAETITPVTPPVKDDTAPVPADIPTVMTPQQDVPSPNITIGTPDDTKEKIKKEREPREIVPYIAPPEPKSKAQRKYVTKMQKLPKSRMRLITLDQADISYGRLLRSPEYILKNPANLGIRSEFGNTFSIIPINTMDIDLKTSTRPFVFMERYLSTGEALTPAQTDSMIALLGPNGLQLPLDINLPTVLNFKMSMLGGSLFANAGLFIQERSTIPGDFFDILFKGATVDNPFQMTENLGVDLTAYAKGSAGYGTFIELPGVLGEIRLGATVNAYAGAFSSVNITNLELTPGMENISVHGTAQVLSFLDTLSFIGDDGFNPQFGFGNDYLSIPGITMGYDFGLAWRFKLNRLLPIAPNFLKNYFDFQVGIEDLGASIKMNNAYLREIDFVMEADPLLVDGFGDFNNIGDQFNPDSMMTISESVIYADSTITQPLGTKLNLAVNYQPIPQLMLKGGITTFLTEGLNSNSGQNYFYGVDIFPVSSLCIHGSVTQKGNYRYSEAGIKYLADKSEFGLKVRIYDLDFSLTENLSGAGIQLNWARYF